MLKTVSSITNAIGALNFKGTWNASTNTPTLASGVGTKGDYFVVGTAGSTTLDGISTWGIGDWATYNGSVWQRVEGGADLEGVNLSVSGTSTLSALTASTALALNASKQVVSVTNTGTGNNVLSASPTFSGDVVNTGTVKSPSFFTSTQTGTGVVSGTPIDFPACDIPQNSSFLVTAKYVVGSGNNAVRTSIVSKQASGAGSAAVTSLNTDFSVTTPNVAIAVTNNGSDTIIRATVTTTAAGGSCTVTCVRIG